MPILRDCPLWSLLVGAAFLIAFSIVPAAGQGIGDPTPIEGNVHEIVTLTAEDGVPVTAFLMYPKSGIDPHTPGIVFHHGGFGGHPARQVGAPRFAAERLAAQGYTTLSLLSRQSTGHSDSLFEDSQKDIRAAVDFLATRGMSDIVLAAHSLGSIRISGYLADTKDPRVKAAIHFAPTADMPDARRETLGADVYEKEVSMAREAVAAGRGRLDLSPDPARAKGVNTDPVVDLTFTFQSPEVYLNWWGPEARTRNSDRFEEIDLPMLLLSGTEDPFVPQGRLKQLKRAAASSSDVEYIWYDGVDHFFSGVQDQAGDDVAAWLAEQGLGVKPRITTRLVDAQLASGRYFPGVLYTPQSGADTSKPVFLLQHGYTGTIGRNISHHLGVRLAQAGYTALEPMTRSSGFTGVVRAKFDNMAEDLGAWVGFLEDQGFSEVVTVGHSLGGIWTALYMSRMQDERIRGMVFLAPTRDMTAYSKDSLGAERYDQVTERARQLVADGTPEVLITDKFYRPLPAPDGERSMYIQSAESWLDYWGPDSPGDFTARLGEIDVPVLAIAGSKDDFVSEFYMRDVKQAAAGPVKTVWYGGEDGAGHYFIGYEDRVAQDILDWVSREVSKD